MTRPVWVLIVGLLMIIIAGGGGIMSDLKQINTRDLVQLGDELSQEISNEIDTITLSPKQLAILQSLVSSDTLLTGTITGEKLGTLITENTWMSESAKMKMIRHGYMGLFVSGLFLIFGILMIFSNKPYVIKGTFIVLIISLLFVGYQILDFRSADMADLMNSGKTLHLLLGSFLDIILLLICGKCSKEYFFRQSIDYYN